MTRIPKYNSLLFCFVKEAAKSTYTLYKKDCYGNLCELWKVFFFCVAALHFFAQFHWKIFCCLRLRVFCSIETQSMWSIKEEIFICPLSQNGVKIVVAILHFSRLKTKGRGGSEHLPANVRHIENVLKVVSFLESLRRPLTHFSSSSSSTLRDSLGMFLSGWNLSEGVSKQ